MSKKLFTSEEVEELSKNPYVQSVSPKGITYTHAFKEIFLEAYAQGKLPREIFKSLGFRVEVIGIKRINSSQSPWSESYKKDGFPGLQDGRKARPEINHQGGIEG